MSGSESEAEPDVGDGNNNNVDSPPSDLPWPALQSFFEKVRDKDSQNVQARCLQCKKIYSCARSSSSNLEKHLKKHPTVFSSYEEKKAMSGNKKRPRVDSGGQMSLTSLLNKGAAPLVTQGRVDSLVMAYIVMNSLPFDTVESPYFKKLVLLGLRPSLHVICSKTLIKLLGQKKEEMQKDLKKSLMHAMTVSTTADAWSKHKRAYLGMTIHWIDNESLNRKSAAIGVRRLVGQQTNTVLAKNVDDIHKEYEVHNKVCKTTTDNGANFVKAFKAHSQPENAAASDASTTEATVSSSPADDNDDDWDSTIALTGNLGEHWSGQDDDAVSDDVILPPHQRCASHTLNLVASKDALKALKIACYNKVYLSCFAKLRKLWTRQNKSSRFADIIHEKLGVYLQTPTVVRWNSEFDAVFQVSELAKNNLDKLHSVFDASGLTRLTAAEMDFLSEYSLIMGFVAKSLDILQGEKKMYYGYLLPTIEQLQKRIQSSQETPGLKYCQPLANELLLGISKRFEDIIDNEEAILSACVHPKFKLDWLDDNNKRSKAKKIVLNALVAEAVKEGIVSPTETLSSSTPVAVPMADEDDDFFCFSTEQALSGSMTTPEEVAEAEYKKFLLMSKDLSVLQKEFPLLKNVFIRTNTPLPSSASVERLFSLSGIVLSARRARLTDEHMETQVLLKANAEFVSF